MNKSLKILIELAVITTVGGIFPLIGLAQTSPVESINDVMNILRSIVNVMYTAFFIVAIAFIILAAFNYLTAQDDAEKIKSATRQIMWAAVAIAVALVSVGFNQIVENFLK